jgi:two-component system sensor histidine kinase CreC
LRQPGATIWGLPKNQVNNRIYVTDAKGVVLLDSSGEAVGQDYSRWNDVYLTLRGEYGARSTRSDPQDPDSSVMHVGAPIRDEGHIIGVVTVAKPNSSLQPYVDRTERRLLWYGAGLVLLGLLFGALLSWWLSKSLRRLTDYAQAVSEGRRAELPKYRGGELAQLSVAVEHMRTQLEGKAYVERYVHTLTHELKSPLAAIRGAAELLEGDMPADQRRRFVGNIGSESARMQQLIERLLNLAMVEQRQGLEEHALVSLSDLIEDTLAAQRARIESRLLRVEQQIAQHVTVTGEHFLLRQGFANLLDNALDFTPLNGTLRFTAERVSGGVEVTLFNTAEPIPDYALPRLSERFYSLSRPDGGRKSTGLGLNFVEEVMQLHGGELRIGNVEGGVVVRLVFPR